MTALDRILAAIEAGRDPAPGTMKAAAAEIDDTLRAVKISIFHALLVTSEYEKAEEYWNLTLQLSELKGSILAQKIFNTSLKNAVAAIAESITPQAEVVEMPMIATKCSNCHTRDAKVWEKGVAYCKQCAKELGIDFHGKV